MFEKVRHIVLKTTRSCNLQCKYCHMLDKTKWAHDEISDEVLIAFVKKLAKERTIKEKVHITLHGGETTFLGLKKVEHILAILTEELEKYSNLKKNYSFSLQTNGTLINEDWISVIRKYKVDVGVSFDGVKANNTMRCNTANRVIDTLALLKKNSFNTAVLSILTQQMLSDLPAMQAFFEKNQIKYKVNRCEDIDPNVTAAVSFEDYYNYLFLPIVKKLINKDVFFKKDFVEEHTYNTVLSALRLLRDPSVNFKPMDGNCGIPFCGSGTRVIAVNPDGNIQPCGRVAEEEYNISSVFSYTFLGLSDVKFRMALFEEQLIRNRRNGCETCNISYMCSHPCWAFSRLKPEEVQFAEERGLCEFTHKAYEFIKENQDKLNYLLEK